MTMLQRITASRPQHGWGRRTIGAMLVAGAAAASPVCAQPPATENWTVEAVVSGSADSHGPADPFLMFDATATGRIHQGLDLIVRPYAHRLTGGEWAAEMYQLQLRYVAPTRVALRLDAGIIGAPVGLTTLELIASRNPTIGAPFFYFAPLPRFDLRYEGVQLISGGYPLGAIVSSSGAHWDVRGGVTDQSPTRRRNVFAADRPAAARQLVAGGGYTPVAGVRVGASVSHGAYRQLPASTAPALSGTEATVVTVEGEYAAGYSRFAGEWIQDTFETAGSPAIARGFTLEASRTITARWFAAARASRASSPVFAAANDITRRAASSGELTLGYRLSPDVTVRGAYQTSRWFGVSPWQRAVVLSAVWARRWH